MCVRVCSLSPFLSREREREKERERERRRGRECEYGREGGKKEMCTSGKFQVKMMLLV